MTVNGKELRLLKPEKKSLLRIIFGRTGIITLLMLAQCVLLLELPNLLSIHFPLAFSLLNGTAATVMGLHIINTDAEPTIKLTWLGIVMLLPLFGSLLYAYIHSDLGHRVLKRRMQNLMDMTRNCLHTSEKVHSELAEEGGSLAQLETYLARTGCYPVYQNTKVTYYPIGEEAFAAMLEQLEKAEHFIFLEYFIVEEGHMWGQILEILARKASEGLEVRLLYDGTCEFSTLPRVYPEKLRKLGIKCKMFAPIMPFVSTHYNYRDHRKIMVIDGKVSFTGGINLADEYINKKVKYGHWKDNAIMLQGEATRSFTLMFLQMWHVDQQGPHDLHWLEAPLDPMPEAEGYVMPYGDCPLDDYRVGEMVYIDILSRAQKYVYIMTPYLIVDGELENALLFAAQRGVDVRMILPGIPDKKIVNALAKGSYERLVKNGVKIYEYKPGFVHSKVMVCDGEKAVVGTINLDYRSLYHHFECAAYIYKMPQTIESIRRDVMDTLAKCRRITLEAAQKQKLSVRWTAKLVRILAPLL